MEDKTILTTFMDAVGRTIIGEMTSDTDKTITIKNPVVIHITPQVDGANTRMALQLFPLFFREFLMDRSEPIEWDFLKSNITLPRKQPIFDFKLAIQYKQLFIDNIAPATPKAPAPINNPSIIKLFDD